MEITFHYPPELLELLIDAIPKLIRSKEGIIAFFDGAGVSRSVYRDIEGVVRQNKDQIKKYDIVRSILIRLNEKGEASLGERREILKRITEWEDFSTCWPGDEAAAKGYVSDIRRIVNIKDSFTRMNIERERERQKRLEREKAAMQAAQKRKQKLDKIRRDLGNLFSLKDPNRRGKEFESLLNRLFDTHDMSIKKSFTISGDHGEGIIEQIDGVIEIDGHIYFVEAKWWTAPLGVAEISQHLIRVYQRAETRAIIISASDYTSPAITTCREALQQKVVILCTLQEIVMLLENEGDFKQFLLEKIRRAMIEKNPF